MLLKFTVYFLIFQRSIVYIFIFIYRCRVHIWFIIHFIYVSGLFFLFQHVLPVHFYPYSKLVSVCVCNCYLAVVISYLKVWKNRIIHFQCIKVTTGILQFFSLKRKIKNCIISFREIFQISNFLLSTWHLYPYMRCKPWLEYLVILIHYCNLYCSAFAI